MFKVARLNPIASIGTDLFTGKYEMTENLAEASAVLVRSASMHELELPDGLLAIARAGAGVNNIPLNECAKKGIVVFNAPGANANGVKEMVLAGMLLGASYLYTRNLCFPISLHLFWNWIQGPILGYQVSGNNFTTSMLTLRMPEENVLNGGAFGFEGSLICTVLMIVFTILIVWWGEKREAISLAVPRSY